MIDALGRNIEYMRISVTDRCNMRCMYCMPHEGVVWRPHEEMLSYDEIVRLCKIFAALGISKIKLTGGEPLVRKNLSSLVKRIKSLDGIENVTLTTNGLFLAQQLDALSDAGLDAVNISVDTFDEDVFQKITGASGVQKIREAINKALTFENIRVKVNCVPLKGINDDSLAELALLAKDHRLSVRFIEMMPIGLGRQFEAFKEDELKTLLEKQFGPMTYFNGKLGNGPCRYYTVEGFRGKIGFISAVSHRFCDKCNRIRLTSEGFLKTCLQYNEGSDLKALLRSGKDDEEIQRCIRDTIFHKPEGHHFGQTFDAQCSKTEEHKMFQIGG
ncbi:MAG: GTP 3',8-cyclase MoaA [Lachnospiraceae bacterium]|nr:GTP 3',8-cyclase MoaA [Lachnospiraceae bacterium]